MKRFAIPAVSVLVLVFASHLSEPRAQSADASVVKERQQLMKKMGGSFGPIIAVAKGESDDFAAAQSSAQTIHDSIVKLQTLFPAGTGVGEVSGSRAKLEIWAQRAEFDAAAQNLEMAAAGLAEAAAAANIDVYRQRLAILGNACGGCHEGASDAGGKFRMAEQ